MSWNDVIGQESVKRILQKAIIEGKTANSYLFLGEEGVGKEAMAIEFAKVLNCENPISEAESIEADDSCSSCSLFSTLSHPNLTLVYPLPAGGGKTAKDSPLEGLSDKQIEEIKAKLAEKAKNPYAKIRLAKANQIKIASIRELKRKLTLSKSSKGTRCALIFEADKMNEEAANAFLKTLEEPNEDVKIILTASDLNALPRTIASRCQIVHFKPLSREEIERVLIEKFEADPNEAKTAAAFAKGSATEAAAFLDADAREIRDIAIACLKAALRRRNYKTKLFEESRPIIESKDRNVAEYFLKSLAYWFRDAMRAKATGSLEGSAFPDYVDSLERFVSNFPELDYERAMGAIELAQKRNRRNVNLKALIFSLTLELRRIALSRD